MEQAMRRAISDTQKAARREQLLAAAWQIFQERPYQAIAVQEVAARAGLAKGTVYLYVASKEELFLAVLEEQFAAWFNTVDIQLNTLGDDRGIDPAVAAIAEALIAQPHLVRLFTIAHAVLEQNVALEPILRFKRLLAERLARTGALLETVVGALAPSSGAAILLNAYALAVGLQSMAHPPPSLAEALTAAPELAAFQIAFAPAFTSGLAALIRGWEK
jgi:AcrR family transcriptional regulator